MKSVDLNFPAESPATFETPLLNGSETPMSCSSRASNASKSSRKRDKSISDGHTLDSFMSTYTSEDNQSFEELIEAADAKLQQRFAALYDAEKSTALAIENSLKLPSIEQQFEVIEGTKNVSFGYGETEQISNILSRRSIRGHTQTKTTSCTCQTEWN